MNYEEFAHLTEFEDPEMPYAKAYQLEDGGIFYIEPVFYTKLLRVQERFPEQFGNILEEMQRIVKINKRVVFVGNFESPLVDKEGFIYREILDITNELRIFAEDIYRGSDYGD